MGVCGYFSCGCSDDGECETCELSLVGFVLSALVRCMWLVQINAWMNERVSIFYFFSVNFRGVIMEMLLNLGS